MAGTTGALLSVLATSLVALGLFRYALATRRSSSLPPGPPTIPFLGGIQRPRSIVCDRESNRRHRKSAPNAGHERIPQVRVLSIPAAFSGNLLTKVFS